MSSETANNSNIEENNNIFGQYTEIDIDDEFANSVTLASLVKILVSKGIVTVEELLSVERHNRDFHHSSESYSTVHKTKRKGNLLKRIAVRHRWSRRLTTRLFGWQWKKISASSNKNRENDK